MDIWDIDDDMIYISLSNSTEHLLITANQEQGVVQLCLRRDTPTWEENSNLQQGGRTDCYNLGEREGEANPSM